MQARIFFSMTLSRYTRYMSSSFVKQIIFGALYIVMITAVGYGIFTAIRPQATCFDNKKNQKEEAVDCGGPCESCAIKHLKPITASPVTIVPASADTISTFFELTNPNTTYGAQHITYSLTFYDIQGMVLHTLTRGSFLYPAEIRTIADVGLSLKVAEIVRAEVSLTDTSWVLASGFSKPHIDTRSITIETNIEKNMTIVRGLVVNRSALPLARVSVGAIIKNDIGIPTGISKTVLSTLAAFEERAFSIFIPGSTEGEITSADVKLFIEVVIGQ